MIQPDQIVILFSVGVIAGFINVMAGGGSALTLPALIFMGLEGSLANGTNRVAIFIQNVFAVSSFSKNKFQSLKQSLKYAAMTLPGAIIGALVAVRISDELFEKVLAIIMVGIIITLFLPGQRHKDHSRITASKWLYPALFALGFYGGFIQMGVGFILMATLFHLAHYNLVHVNMHKVAIILIYTIPALTIFVLTGNVNWPLGISLSAGNAVGGWWGAHVTIRGGEKWIKIVLAVAMILMASKLVGIF
jgi:uncharacterized protein